ncbi:MAG: hypothetical protein Q8P81_03650 [Nanoarchaeota archaeon]|nr:hypothetical protein [Nanoarchaeota archaeon]
MFNYVTIEKIYRYPNEEDTIEDYDDASISEWLREGEEVKELKKQIESLQQEIKRIKQVVKELIDISHINKHKG